MARSESKNKENVKAAEAGDTSPPEAPTEEQLGHALREAQVISEEDLKGALQEKEKSGKTLMELLRRKVTWQNLKEVVNCAIHTGGCKTTMGDVLVQGRWMTPVQLAEARLEMAKTRGGLAKALLDRGAVTLDELKKAEEVSNQTGHSLWRTLINMGLVQEKAMMEILRSQYDLIGELLVKEGKITQKQLDEALEKHEATEEKTGQILIKMGALKEADLAEALAQQAGAPFVDLDKESIDYGAAFVLPSSLIQQFRCLPIRKEDDAVLVALDDPTKISALMDAGLLLGVEVKPAIATRTQVEAAIEKYLSWRKEQKGVAPPAEMPPTLEVADILGMKDLLERASVPRLVSSIMEKAIKSRATDIHLDPQDTGLRVRFRIDGLLQDVIMLPPQMSSGVVTRLKILANMNIVQRRLPQDGHIHLELEGREYDMRVASVNTSLGEKLVLRLLVEENVLTGLSQLGLEPHQREELESLIAKPYGLLLVTGPVGSGKTTTLYSCINQVNILTRNVMTIEDPIEYKLRGTNQLEVNTRINFDFPDGLRALLRQDPDILMVGEIRDDETARTTIRAAMTGVLAFSTLHANDSAGAVMALVHHGVPRFLISSAVIGIISQRLVRQVCKHCQEEYTPPMELCLEMGLTRDEATGFKAKRGTGCPQCFYTGYRGRTGIFEIMTVTEELADLILKQAGKEEVRQAAIASGMQTLHESALNKVREGITTPELLFATVFV